jgi:hypothetical protein
MSLTYDQMSELSMAFREAHVPADRRRSQRIRQRIAAEIIEWDDDHPGRTFGVMIEDFSPTGVGMIHTGRLKTGGHYTLEIPRPGHPPIRVVLTVVRCEQMDGGMFSTQMEASEILAGRISQSNCGSSVPVLLALLIITSGIAAAYYFGLIH